ncbi:MAG: hypothetical protein M3Y72_27540 [Acidobacteriota bacterium]|nr:hypothetical protein [Acidobacteriota bacterium]
MYDGLRALKTLSHRRRQGTKGTRELVFTPLPYIAAYRLTPTHIEISRIWHGAQQRQ